MHLDLFVIAANRTFPPDAPSSTLCFKNIREFSSFILREIIDINGIVTNFWYVSGIKLLFPEIFFLIIVKISEFLHD